jgi:NAD(P)H-nitrite reductase large subunit
MPLPAKFKMAVSGCANSCSEPAIKDIGVMGTPKGYTLMVGGNAAIKPRLADVIADELTEDEVLQLVDKIISFCKTNGSKHRLGRVIDEMGLDKFKEEIGL